MTEPYEIIDEYCRKLPQIYQATYRKAMEGNSRQAAIYSKCLECMNWQREEVRNCNIYHCPLWPYRPYQKAVRSNSGAKLSLSEGSLEKNGEDMTRSTLFSKIG